MDYLLDTRIQTGLLIVLAVGYWFYKDVWTALRPNYLRVYVLQKTGELKRYYKPIVTENGKQKITVADGSFSVMPDRVYRMGLFRVPTSFYKADILTPLDLQKPMNVSGAMTPSEYQDAIENHVARDALRSFAGQRVSPDTALTLTLVIVIGANAFVWWMLDKKLTEILEVLARTN